MTHCPIPCDDSQPFIFVSYAHRDSDRVFPIIEYLQSQGYPVWFDEGIDPGSEWDEMIAMHVKKCACMLAMISEAYIASDNCRDELNFARDLNKGRLLIYLEKTELPDGMAMRLNRLQAIHMYTYSRQEDFYDKLMSATVLDEFGVSVPEEPFQPRIFRRATPLQAEFDAMFDNRPIRCEGIRLFDGAYALEKLLGKGANCHVYLARTARADKPLPVALKLMSYAYNARQMPIFRSPELRQLLDSKKPACIPAVYDAVCFDYDIDMPDGVSPWKCGGYIAAEYIAGDTLAEVCRKGAFTERQALDHLIMMCDALSEIHALGLHYGDLSPENVMISNGRAYLVDSSSLDFDGACPYSVTVRIGEPDGRDTAFTSPEFVLCRPCDVRSDIFSLGMMAQYLFFEKGSAEAFNAMQRRQLQFVINTATQQNPARRYGSVAGFRMALQSALLANEHLYDAYIGSSAPESITAIRVPEAAIGARLFDDRYELMSTGKPCPGGVNYTVRHVKYGFTLSLTLYGRDAAKQVPVVQNAFLRDRIPACIPPIYDLGVFESFLPECVVAPEGCCGFVVSALVEGTPLSQLASGGLSPGEAVRYCRRLMSALSSMHAENLCCGALRDSHILIDGDDVYLTDPSCIHMVFKDEPFLSSPGSILPDGGWISPEAVAGKYFNRRSDVYVLGKAMEYLLFERSGAAAALTFFRKRRLQTLIKTATQTDPAKRFSDIDEMMKQFDEVFPPEKTELSF